MRWPLLFVIGLVIIAALISMLYMMWLQSVLDYSALGVEEFELNIVAEIRLDNERSEVGDAANGVEGAASEGEVAYVVIYREDQPKPAWQLSRQLRSRAKERFPGWIIEEAHMSREPGFNAFRIWNKQREWFFAASQEWMGSAFHAFVMPIEILVRFTLFPVWTMIDFISHERCAVAALVMPSCIHEKLARETFKDLSLVESYYDVYASPTSTERITVMRANDRRLTLPVARHALPVARHALPVARHAIDAYPSPDARPSSNAWPFSHSLSEG